MEILRMTEDGGIIYKGIVHLRLFYEATGSVFQFNELINAGIIKWTDKHFLSWTLSKSSLVDYVKRIRGDGKKYWTLLEKIFNYRPGTLKRLASTNGNIYKLDNPGKPSKDFSKVLKIIGGC